MILPLVIWANIVGHAVLINFHVEAGKAERAQHAAVVMCLNDYGPACDELSRQSEEVRS